jgi:uncharacterized protein
VARELLSTLGFTQEDVELVADAIIDHSFSQGKVPRTDLGKALQDADRLEALGALGIFRLISTGTKMGAHYFHPDDPWAQNRPLDDKKFSVDHFFTKLLKLPETMNTTRGKLEATKRAAFLTLFLDTLRSELV